MNTVVIVKNQSWIRGPIFTEDILPPGFTTKGKKLLSELSCDDELKFKSNKAQLSNFLW